MNKNIIRVVISTLLLSLILYTNSSVSALEQDFNPIIEKITEENNKTYTKTIKKEIKEKTSAEISLEFKRPSDEITYDIIIKNDGNKLGTLKNINLTNNNKKVKYEVTGIKVGDVLKANNTQTIRINATAPSSLEKSKDKVSIALTYEDEDGNLITVKSPNTYDNIMKYFVIFIISLLLIILLVTCLKNKKNKNTKIITIFLLGLIISKVDVNAVAGALKINFDITINPIEVWNGEVAENCFKNGAGTNDSPYLIEDGKELACFAKSVNEGNTYENEYVSLSNDIILNENVIVNDNLNENYTDFKEWTPAGNSYDKFFSGTFNGDNHYISGIYINDSSTYKGLFGSTKNAKISNLKINDSYIKAGAYAGNVVGFASNNITANNIETNGIINVGSTGAGIVGFSTNNSEMKITDCINKAKIIGNSNMGGIIGIASSVKSIEVKNSYNIGDIEGSYSTAGIIGNSYSNSILLENVYNKGNVKSTGGSSAGIIGNLSSSSDAVNKLNNVYNAGKVSGSYSVGGIIGNSYSYIEINNAYNKGEIVGCNQRLGGLVGYVNSLTLKDSYNLGNVNGETTNGSSSSISGLIGEASQANVDNCYNKSDIKGSSQVSGIIGRLTSGEIKNTYNVGNINGGLYTGGIAGQLDQSATINNCYNEGKISGNNGGHGLGGIVGFAMGTTKKVYNKGNVSGKDLIGGIIGYSLGNIEDSYNIGDVSGYSNIGGIVGIQGSNAIKHTYNIGNITGTYEIGGITGQLGSASGSSSEKALILNTINAGNLTINYEENNSTNDTRSFGGLAGLVNISDSTDFLLKNNYSLGKIKLDSKYENLIENTDYYLGSVFGKLEHIKTINVTNSNYYVYGTKGIGLNNLDIDFTKKISVNEIPNLLSIINENDSFKEDTKNINNGYPIFK